MDISVLARGVQLQLLGIVFKAIDLTEVTRESVDPPPRGQIQHRHPGLLYRHVADTRHVLCPAQPDLVTPT